MQMKKQQLEPDMEQQTGSKLGKEPGVLQSMGLERVRHDWSDLAAAAAQFVLILRVKGFGMLNKAEVDVFLELSCFMYDPADVWQFDLCFLSLF